MDKLLSKTEEIQYVLDFSFLTELYGKLSHAAGCRDEQRVSRVGEHPLRQGRREDSWKRQCLNSDTVQCVYSNNHRMKNMCVLMKFCSCLKLRGMASVAGHDIIFHEELGALAS